MLTFISFQMRLVDDNNPLSVKEMITAQEMFCTTHDGLRQIYTSISNIDRVPFISYAVDTSAQNKLLGVDLSQNATSHAVPLFHYLSFRDPEQIVTVGQRQLTILRLQLLFKLLNMSENLESVLLEKNIFNRAPNVPEYKKLVMKIWLQYD